MITALSNRRQIADFLALPTRINERTRGAWIAPPRLFERFLMGRTSSPDRHFFLAYQGDTPVARLGVKIHRLGTETELRFGFFAAFDGHQKLVCDMFARAQAVAPDLPMQGPHQFSMEDPYNGLLVEGFELEPYFLMAHNPPYYESLLLGCGFCPVQDLLSFRMTRKELRPARIKPRAEHARSCGVTVRTLGKNRYSDIRRVSQLMNQVLAENWGFEDIRGPQFWEMYLFSFLLLDPEWFFLAEYQGDLVGVAILLPNYNLWFKETRGSVTLDLLAKLLFKRNQLTGIRSWALGVTPEARPLNTAPLIIDELLKKGLPSQYQETEIGWVLAENAPMVAMLKAVGGQVANRYRVYRRQPEQARKVLAQRDIH